MRKFHFIVAAVLLALAAGPRSSAQKQVLPRQFGSWSCQPTADDVEFDRIANSADLEKEAGLISFEVCDYLSGTAKVRVHLQKYRDPSSAYEMYTALIRPDMHPSTLGRTSAVDGDRLFALVGAFIIEVRPTPLISDPDLDALVKSVSGRADQTPLPPIRAYLPRGFTDGTQRYARGPAAFRNAIAALKRDEFANLVNEAGFNLNAEAMFAHYREGKDEAVLLLIDYPTPQLAEQHLRHLEQAISAGAKQAGTTIERKATLLSLVLRPSSAAYGNSLRSAVNYETEVTWNEPRQTVTDPPLLTTVAKIIIATVVFMVVAVVLGAAFGGVRVLAKIFFPGKFFDRPEQMDVLQLGLSGKRIDSRDFY
jgi:uncharacterized protein DUF6599